MEVAQNKLTSGIVKYLRILIFLAGLPCFSFPISLDTCRAINVFFYHQIEIAFRTVEHLPPTSSYYHVAFTHL